LSEPPRKIDAVRRAMAAGAWETAIALAAKFPRLGDEQTAIMQAREAYTRPDFQRQLGRDPEQLKADGIAALKGKYGV